MTFETLDNWCQKGVASGNFQQAIKPDVLQVLFEEDKEYIVWKMQESVQHMPPAKQKEVLVRARELLSQTQKGRTKVAIDLLKCKSAMRNCYYIVHKILGEENRKKKLQDAEFQKVSQEWLKIPSKERALVKWETIFDPWRMNVTAPSPKGEGF